MTTAFEKLQSLSAEYKTAKSKLNEIEKQMDKKTIVQAFQDLMVKYPDLLQITWSQYAPYFNDGEPCVFGVHEPSLRLASAIDADEFENGTPPTNRHTSYPSEDDGYVDPYYDDVVDLNLKADFNSIWDMLSEDVLELAFGSDSWVYIDRDGVTIKHHDHD